MYLSESQAIYDNLEIALCYNSFLWFYIIFKNNNSIKHFTFSFIFKLQRSNIINILFNLLFDEVNKN